MVKKKQSEQDESPTNKGGHMGSRSFQDTDTTDVKASPILEKGSIVEVELRALKFKEGQKQDGDAWKQANAALKIVSLVDAKTDANPEDIDPIYHSMWLDFSDVNAKRAWALFKMAFGIKQSEMLDTDDEGYFIFAESGARVNGVTAFCSLGVRTYNDVEQNVVTKWLNKKGDAIQLPR